MEIHTLENLKRAILDYDAKASATWASKALDEGIDPVRALEALTQAVRQVGDGYGRGELFLPDLVGAAEAMMNAMPIIEQEIKRRGMKREKRGTVAIGTVLGDIHNIGKIMVSTLLQADGFDVIDLGIDVPSAKFVEAVKEYKPDALALSALMSTTAPEQGKAIDALRKEGIRDKVKIMVGGSAITNEFARSIGADGYESTAVRAVTLTRRLLGLN